MQATFLFPTSSRTTHINTFSLHDALPISQLRLRLFSRTVVLSMTCRHSPTPRASLPVNLGIRAANAPANTSADRKSTRLNSSHVEISYAVFCLKKKCRPHNYFRRVKGGCS